MGQKVPCKQCGVMILPATADKTGGLCMPCYKKVDQVEHQSSPIWKVLFGLVIVVVIITIIIIVTRFVGGSNFPEESIHVAPGKSATCNLKANSNYVGTYYIGSASVEILTKLPTFLHVQANADMVYGFVEKGTVGNPEVTLIVSADSNATLGIYPVEGRFQAVQFTEDFKINIIVNSFPQYSFEDFMKDILPPPSSDK